MYMPIRVTCEPPYSPTLVLGLHYASSSFLILRSGGSVLSVLLRSLLPPLLWDDVGSVLILTWDGEVEGGGGGGKSDGWEVVGRRLRFFFFVFFGAVVTLLLDGEDREAAAPPSDP